MSEFEFEIGDRVKQIKSLSYGGSPYATITCIKGKDLYHKHDNETTDVWFAPPDCFILIERKPKMSKYQELKERIEKLSGNSTLKEMDGILQEILPNLPTCCYPKIKINMNQSEPTVGSIVSMIYDKEGFFAFDGKGDYTDALKSAFIWLLNHSNHKDERQEKIDEIMSKVTELQEQIKELKEARQWKKV